MDQAKATKKTDVVKVSQDSKIEAKGTLEKAVVDEALPEKVGKEAKSPEPMLKKIPKSKMSPKLFMVVASVLVVLSGVGTGWLLSGVSKGAAPSAGVAPQSIEKSDKEAGIDDAEAFPDTAEGILEEGGIEGEGTHHLVREGGPSKYAYLTSTVIDLESFKGKSVQIWGETISAKYAGWLMDVGKIKVIE